MTNHNDAEAFQRMTAARASLVLDNPFFGLLALRLALVEDPTCKTMWVDGKRLGYSPQFVKAITHSEAEAVFCHEVLHVSNGHTWRRRGRKPQRWNAAADYAINPLIRNVGLRLPGNALLDDRWAALCAEEIYDRMPEEGQGGGSGGSGDGDDDPAGEVRDYPDPDGAAHAEAEWNKAVVAAAKAAHMRGKLPGELKRMISEAVRPRTDWRSLLRRFVQSAAKSDFTWVRPNRRYMRYGLLLPSLRSDALGPIVIGVDTSGSIGGRIMDRFAAEVRSVADETLPEEVVVMYVDAAVQRVDRFVRGEVIEVNPCGGGGTDFRPFFERIEKEGIAPACAIYLTDLCGSAPETPPPYPVLWACTTEHVGPFGETVRIEYD